MLRSSSTISTGTGLVAASSAIVAASAGGTGPSRTMTTWSGGRVCSCTLDVNATARYSGWSPAQTGSSSDSFSGTDDALSLLTHSDARAATPVTRDTRSRG